MQEEQIDFEKEVAEFTKYNFVKDIEFSNKKTQYIEMKITTLEDHIIYVICSTSKGIEVQQNSSILKEKLKFDTFEGLLTTYSQQYEKKFTNDLNSRLLQIQRLQQKEEEEEERADD